MSLSISNESKDNLTITNEDKGLDQSWAEADFSWEDSAGTWATQKVPISKESKNSLSISNEAKS